LHNTDAVESGIDRAVANRGSRSRTVTRDDLKDPV
jgi:hypothetical protein